MIDEKILLPEERVSFALRALYSESGYARFKMSKFEEYDFYSKHKDFLVSDSIITFTDAGGKLFALKPDVTLSIVKNVDGALSGTVKYYYSESVYRPDSSGTYKEITQTGLECIGEVGAAEVTEVTKLAARSLSLISEDFILALSHIGLVKSLISAYGVKDGERALAAVAGKNSGELKAMLTDEQFAALRTLVKKYKSTEELLFALEKICITDECRERYSELSRLYFAICESGYGDKTVIDASISGVPGYYSGIVFKGYVKGIPQSVLSGGMYDGLMRSLGKQGRAIGFAVYLDMLERIGDGNSGDGADEYLNIALPKGRLGEQVYAMLERAGFECPEVMVECRKLIFENSEKKIRYFWVKPSDVAIYVERGAADIGIAGKDIILEYEPDVYELLDLGVGKCRMAVAAKRGFSDDKSRTLKVATKFSNIAKNYYAKDCREIDIIHLNGSIELAPILSLSDVIVDIVETGKTLAENDLVVYKTICEISARLISNKVSYGFKSCGIERIKKGLLEVISGK